MLDLAITWRFIRHFVEPKISDISAIFDVNLPKLSIDNRRDTWQVALDIWWQSIT